MRHGGHRAAKAAVLALIGAMPLAAEERLVFVNSLVNQVRFEQS